MSRLYVTASMQHSSFGIALPVFSVETADHTGGGFHVGGLHPSSLAALSGKGPVVKKGERFDLKFNVNAKRCSLSLVVNTRKHLPHLEWSSENGMGKLPLGMSTLASSFLLGNKGSSNPKRQSERISRGRGYSGNHRDSQSSRSRHASRPRQNHEHRYREEDLGYGSGERFHDYQKQDSRTSRTRSRR